MQKIGDSTCIVCGNPVSDSGVIASIRGMKICCCKMHSESVWYETQEFFGMREDLSQVG